MLKGIPSILTPELLKILMEMGHGDELLICDGNYPKFGCPERCIRSSAARNAACGWTATAFPRSWTPS